MTSFTEFETVFLGALQQERSDLQGLLGASEAQLSAWIQHLFQQFLGYTHWKEINREGNAPIGSKGSKQLFPDLRIDILDTGHIFVEAKRLGRLDGPRGQDERNDAESQLKSYIRAHIDKAVLKPKIVLGVVTDGNRWFLLGLDRSNNFHLIAEWAFLTEDPRLLAQRLWLLAKPALAQPTSALVEFLARRTLAEVLKENTRLLTRKVNDKLPEGAVSEELIGKWLRDAFSDQAVAVPSTAAEESLPTAEPETVDHEPGTEEADEEERRRITLADLIAAKLLTAPLRLFQTYKGQIVEADLLPDGKVVFQGVSYGSCSQAGGVARGHITGGGPMSTNGWTFWQYHDVVSGNQLCLDDARKRYGKAKESQPVPLMTQDCPPESKK